MATSSLWFNYGNYWTRSDVQWAINYLRSAGLRPKTLIQAARYLGRQPDSIVVKLTKQGVIAPRSGYYQLGSCRMTEHEVRHLSELGTAHIAAEFPIDDSFDPLIYRDDQPPKATLAKPDDRVVYLSVHDDKITAANLSWEAAAEIGISEKRVVDITAEARALLERMNPLDALVLRTAIEEGKV